MKSKHARSQLKRKIIQHKSFRRCAVCGDTCSLEVDHIIPQSNGGIDHILNLQILCRTCNAEKGAKRILESGVLGR